MNPITRPRIHIPQNIRMNPIRKSRIRICKNLAIRQPLPIRRDIKPINRRRRREIILARKRVHPGIGHINVLPIRRELDAIRREEVVGDGLDDSCVGFEAVDLRPDEGFGAEVLPVCVAGVGKPEVSGAGVLLDVVEGGEVAAEEVVQEDFGGVGGGVDEGELGGAVLEVAFVAEDDLLALAAVGWGADGVEGCAAVGFGEVVVADGGDGVVVVDVDYGDVDRVVKVAGPVAGGVDFPSGLVVYSSCVFLLASR